MSNKYCQKLLDNAKKSGADAIKTASKRAIQKTAEATVDLTDNKTAHKITSLSKSLRKKNYIHKMRMNQKHQRKHLQ